MFKKLTIKMLGQAQLGACIVIFIVASCLSSIVIPARTAHAAGAVTVSGSGFGNASTGSTTNVQTFSTSGPSYVLVGAAGHASGSAGLTVTSVTATGLSFSKLSGGTIPGYQEYVSEYWGAYSSTAQSSLELTVTLSDAANSAVSIISLDGVQSGNPVGTTIGASVATGNLSATFSSTTAGSMVFAGAMTDYDWSTVTAGSGTTLINHLNVAQFIRSTTAVSGGSQTIFSTGLNGTTLTGYTGVEILAQDTGNDGVPMILNYQARVTNAAGSPISSATNMRFAIYNALSGGSCIWSGWGTGTNGCASPNASQVAVTPINGIFSIALGDTTVSSQNAIPQNAFDNDTRYLEVQMYNGSTWETLSPRKRINASAYAFNANRLNGLSSSSSGSADAHVVATDSSGRIVIGGGASITGGAITLTSNAASTWSTTSGSLTLDASGALNLGTTSASGVSIGRNGMTTTINGNATLGLVAGDSITINSGTMNIANNLAVTLGGGVNALNFDANTLSIDALNNRVGIGTSAPLSQLQIGTSANIPTGMGLAVYQADRTAVFSADEATTDANGRALSVTYEGAQYWTTVIYSNGIVGMGNGSVARDLYFGRGDVSTMVIAGSFDGTTPGNLIVTGQSSSLGGASFTGGAITLTANTASTWSTSSGALTITSAAAASWGTSAGNLTLYAAGSGTGSVIIGSGAASDTPDLLVLGNKNTAGDPSGSVGAMYYNSNTSKFRCYQGAAWTDCIGAGSASLQGAYAGGATITTASSTSIAFTLTSGNFIATGAGSVNLTPTGASSFTSGNALTLTAGAASTWSTSAGALTITGNGGLTLDSATTGNVTLGANANAKTITVGNVTGATSVVVNSGTGAQTYRSTVTTGTTTSSAFVFNASALTTGTALRLTSGSTSGRLIDMNFSNTTGTIITGAYGAARTQGSGTLTGMLLNLQTNVTTPTAGQNVTGIDLQLPAATTTSNTTIFIGYGISAAGAVSNSTAGSIAWRGTSIVVPNITQGAGGSVTASGMYVSTGTITTAGTQNGVYIAAAGVGAGTLNSVFIGNITGGAGTENAITIGTGYDNGINFVGAGTVITAAASAFSITTGTTGSITIDSGTTGAINIGNNANAKAVTIGNTTAGTTLVFNAPAGGITVTGKGTVQASGTLPVCYDGSNILYNGNAATTCISSSRRYKHDIENLTLGLDAVRKLKPVSFVYNDTNLPWLGFIAEDVAEIDTRPITYLNGMINGIDPAQISPIIAQGLKELDAVVLEMRGVFGILPNGSANIVNGRLRFGENGFGMASVIGPINNERLMFIDPSGNEIASLSTTGDLTVSGSLYLGAGNGLSLPARLSLDGTGRVVANGGFASEENGFGQAFSSDAPIAAGTIVTVDSNDANKVKAAVLGDAIIGVVVSHAGFLAGASDDKNIEVVVSGRAMVRVTGDVQPGDAITVNERGIGIKQTAAGAVVGYALQRHGGDDEELISLMVGPYVASGSSLSFGAGITGIMPTNILTGSANLDLAGGSIINARTLSGINGNWVIDENGMLKVVINDNEKQFSLYGLVASNVEVNFSGNAKLEAGHVRVQFSTEQKAVMATSVAYRVIVTPTDNSNGIFIPVKDSEGFDVTELDGGKSGASFDWMVIARRVGYENSTDFGITVDEIKPIENNSNPVVIDPPTPPPESASEQALTEVPTETKTENIIDEVVTETPSEQTTSETPAEVVKENSPDEIVKETTTPNEPPPGTEQVVTEITNANDNTNIEQTVVSP